MWSWLSPIEWQRKAWLIHISGKNFLTESELCDLALSPTEDTLPFVSPGPILPRSQTLHKCPTQPNLPCALAGQMCQLDCNVNFFLPLPTFTLGLHCHRKHNYIQQNLPLSHYNALVQPTLLHDDQFFRLCQLFPVEMHCHRKLRFLFVARIASHYLKVADSLSVTAASLFLPFHTLAFVNILCPTFILI